MIQIFKKIRRNLLVSGNTVKYLKYALGEIALVMIGILLALQINNWNENQKERQIEIKYLKNLKQDLENDALDLMQIKNVRIEKIKAAAALLKIARSKQIEDLYTIDSLRITSAEWVEFVPNNNTFGELRSSGNLRLLKNDSIKSLLLDLSNRYSILGTSRDHMRHDYDQYLYDTQFETINFLEVNDPDRATSAMDWFFPDRTTIRANEQKLRQDYAHLLGNAAFINGLVLLAGNSTIMLSDYDSILADIDRLLELVEADLNRN